MFDPPERLGRTVWDHPMADPSHTFLSRAHAHVHTQTPQTCGFSTLRAKCKLHRIKCKCYIWNPQETLSIFEDYFPIDWAGFFWLSLIVLTGAEGSARSFWSFQKEKAKHGPGVGCCSAFSFAEEIALCPDKLNWFSSALSLPCAISAAEAKHICHGMSLYGDTKLPVNSEVSAFIEQKSRGHNSLGR